MKRGIIGLGNMGRIVASVLVRYDEELLVANRTAAKVEEFVTHIGGVTSSVETIFQEADLIYLAVKPQQLLSLLEKYKDILASRPDLNLVSMAAGVTIAQIEELVGADRGIIRIMPNTPIAVDEGVITYATNSALSETMRTDFVASMVEAAQLFWIEEGQMDAATAMAGCGPAFVYQFIEALADGGVLAGLPRALAEELAVQTLIGGAQMVGQTGLHPGQLKDQVCSPGGATIAGVAMLERAGLRSGVMDAVIAAKERSQELAGK